MEEQCTRHISTSVPITRSPGGYRSLDDDVDDRRLVCRRRRRRRYLRSPYETSELPEGFAFKRSPLWTRAMKKRQTRPHETPETRRAIIYDVYPRDSSDTAGRAPLSLTIIDSTTWWVLVTFFVLFQRDREIYRSLSLPELYNICIFSQVSRNCFFFY